MRSGFALCSLGFLALSAALAITPAAIAQTATSLAALPSTRVVDPVSNNVLSTLKGNVHPLAQARYDQGAASSSMQTGRMMLMLQASDAQKTALHHYLDDLQNPASANYRKWLTPETYGKAYGISDADLAQVEAWLESEGFRIESVPASRNRVVFSGTVASIQSAFHTSIHTYLVNGQTHYANATDPQIPTALMPVIAGIAPMNDFHARPQNHRGTPGAYDPESKRIKPQLTLTDSSNNLYLYVDPADAATIYNTPNSTLNSKFAGGSSYDGTGVTIGVVGYSNINVTDVLNYRTAFLNDTNQAHLPKVIVDGNDPGLLTDGSGAEALLDLEISGGLAPGAALNYYTADSTDLQDGLALAILRALDDNQVSILSVSYGNCEASLQTSGVAQFAAFWEQAAAQGITVTVSTGDSGAAGCDDSNSESVAQYGLAVNGIASTPYNIAVGGTDFDVLANSFSQYVNTTNTANTPPYYGTALGYIPEATWNDSVVTNGLLASNVAYKDSSGNTNIAAGGGGVSIAGYLKPSFQSSLTPADGARDLPDVALFSSDGAYGATWAVCSDNIADGVSTSTYTNCQTSGGTFTSTTTFDGFGGTSTSTPAFAGMLALVSQSLGGVRLGQADNVIYNLAANHYSTVFHDTTVGNISVPCDSATSTGCGSNGFLTGYNTGTGYDLATGLGSLNVSALASAWLSASFTATSTSFTVATPTSTLGNCSYQHLPRHGALTFNIAVSPSAATGDVSLTNTSGVPNSAASSCRCLHACQVGSRSLRTTTPIATINDLPGGTYYHLCLLRGRRDPRSQHLRAGDYAVTVGAESSTTGLSIGIQDASSGATLSGSTMGYGYYAYANAQPYGNASPTVNGSIVPDGVPTGSVVLTYSGAAQTVALNSIGVAEYPLYNQAPGTYTFQAAYSGDVSFLPSSSPTVPLTILKGTTTLTLSTATASSAARPAFKAGRGPQKVSSNFATGGGVALGCLLLLAIPARRRSWRSMLSLLVLIVGGLGLAGGGPIGCGGSSSTTTTTPVSPTGTYTVTVTLGTDSIGAYPTGSITLTGNGNTFYLHLNRDRDPL